MGWKDRSKVINESKSSWLDRSTVIEDIPEEQAGQPSIEEIKQQKLVPALKKFPELKPDMLYADPDKADNIFKQYEAAGVDPKYEIKSVQTPEGIKRTVNAKLYFKGQKKGSKEGFEADRITKSIVNPGEGKTSSWMAALEGHANGWLLGYLPQLQAAAEPISKALAVAFDTLEGQEVEDSSYVESRDINIKRQEQQAEEHPAAYYGAGLAGMIGQGIVLGGMGFMAKAAVASKGVPLTAKAIGAAKAVLKSSAVGAAFGFVWNPGDKEGVVSPAQWEKRADHAATGAVLGGILHGGISIIGGAGKAVSGKLQRAKQAKLFKRLDKPLSEAKQTELKALQSKFKKQKGQKRATPTEEEARRLGELQTEKQKLITGKRSVSEITSSPEYIVNKTMTQATITAQYTAEKAKKTYKMGQRIENIDKRLKLLKKRKAKVEAIGDKEKGPALLKRIEQEETAILNSKNAIQKHKDYSPDSKFGELVKLKGSIQAASDDLKVEIFRDILTTRGVNIYKGEAIGPYYKAFNKVLNQTEKFGIIEEKLGVPVGGLPLKAVEATYAKHNLLAYAEKFEIAKNLKKLRNIEYKGKKGVEGEQLWEWMHYIRTQKDGSYKFDPSELVTKAYKRPAFKGEAPPPEIQELLFKFRAMADENYKMVVQSGQRVGYTEGYVPIVSKVEFKGGLTKYRDKKIGKAGFLQKRNTGMIPEKERILYETDFYKAMPELNQKSINQAAFGSFDEQMKTAIFQAQALQYKELSNTLLRYRDVARGFKGGKVESQAIMAKDIIEGNPEALHQLANLIPKGPGLVEEIAATANSVMYHSLIGVNPNVLVKQFMQPYMVGAAEVGQYNIGRGMVGAYGTNNMKMAQWAARKAGIKPEHVRKIVMESQKELERVNHRLRGADIHYDLLSEPQRKSFKFLANVLNLPGQPGMKMFTNLDMLNRQTSYLAGIRAFDKAAKKGGKELQGLLSQLTTGERNLVIGSLDKYGKQAAREEIGIIFAKRHNYAYTVAERGEWFASGIGKHVPFVHWGANTWMRHMENLRHGKMDTLAKRIGYSYAGATAMQTVLGERFHMAGLGPIEISGGTVQAAMTGLGDLSVFTAASTLASGDAISWVRAGKKLEKAGIFGKTKERKKQIKRSKLRAKEKFQVVRIKK